MGETMLVDVAKAVVRGFAEELQRGGKIAVSKKLFVDDFLDYQ
jgi:hypothetical protein